MNCSAIAGVPMRSWMNFMRSCSFSSLSTTDARAMPQDASSLTLLTISGRPSRDGRLILRLMGNTAKSGTGMRW
jgi:hypothetical protein